jgi:hypothetical protein
MEFTTTAEDMHAIAAELNEIYDAEREQAWAEQDDEPCGSHDLSDDAEALASAGFGADEDYGYYGGDDY